MHEWAKSAVHGRLVKIRIVENNSRCLATQLEQNRLNVLASSRSNDRTNQGATSEVDLAHIRVGNKGIGDGRRIGALVVNDIQDAGRKTSLTEDIAESPEALGWEFGALQHDGITRRDGESNCTTAKDEWGIPI